MTLKTRELIKLLEKEGWVLVRQSGSHMQFRHARKAGTVTVPYHGGNKDIGHGLLNSILRQAGLR